MNEITYDKNYKLYRSKYKNFDVYIYEKTNNKQKVFHSLQVMFPFFKKINKFIVDNKDVIYIQEHFKSYCN